VNCTWPHPSLTCPCVGNVSVDKTFKNAAHMLHVMGLHETVPLYKGCATPLLRPLNPCPEIHGKRCQIVASQRQLPARIAATQTVNYSLCTIFQVTLAWEAWMRLLHFRLCRRTTLGGQSMPWKAYGTASKCSTTMALPTQRKVL